MPVLALYPKFNHHDELSQQPTLSEGVSRDTGTRSRTPSPTPRPSTPQPSTTIIPASQPATEIPSPQPLPQTSVSTATEPPALPPPRHSQCIPKPSAIKKAVDSQTAELKTAKEQQKIT